MVPLVDGKNREVWTRIATSILISPFITRNNIIILIASQGRIRDWAINAFLVIIFLLRLCRLDRLELELFR
jgi:hypothetical protein